MRLIFLGPPGAGKGTQASRVATILDVPHISTGAMLRDHIADGTDLGRQAAERMEAGDLVPDDLVIAMLTDRIAGEDAVPGFILDGFPRNLAQARALRASPGGVVDRVVLLIVDESEIVRRISGRRCCSRGHTFHLDDQPPARPGVCDVDGDPLEQRPDDSEEVVRNRLAVYGRETEPLIGYYEELGLIVEIKASGPIPHITKQILEAVRA
ncbi:MAG: adenylate kinase [Acidimicrobiia bacterium]|nr:adenylate kinase [Acidimicrobiia bacterium]MDH3396846.1 adenylate kinase [Acidimicrobiia bacterium]MDH5616656.1 adenylate kinase [Acidimicrobiia bacterium]